VVCPGFIDVHSHSDLTLLSDPRGRSKIQQGVTTEVNGNCGLAVAPVDSSAAARQVRPVLSPVDPDPGVTWVWTSMAEYLARLRDAQPALNVAVLAGHGAIRGSVLGTESRIATPAELDRMLALLDEALSNGAIGFSTGLSLPPASFAPTEELVAFGQVVRAHDAVFAMHLRTYGGALLEAVAEAIHVGEVTGCQVQISHLVATGRPYWGTVPTALARIDAARGRGVSVAADIYPYTAGSGSLTEILPLWVHDGGPAALLRRLRSSADRERIQSDWRQSFAFRWEDLLVSWVRPEGDTSVVGRTIAELAARRGCAPDEVALDLLAAEDARVNLIAFARSEDDLRAALTHSAVCIGSDGLAVDPEGPSGAGQPHPRGYGTYPRLLAHYVRDQALMPLEVAIHKSTGQPADLFGFHDRGRVRAGNMADLVVLDLDRLTDNATYTDPQRFPSGIELVIVAGEIAVEGGRQSASRTGRVLMGTTRAAG
jgi:N-acyl-D-amino-acid deacylase